MKPSPAGTAVVENEPAASEFLRETLAGLSSVPRTLPCKYFYDHHGAALFQKICELPEYYITRTELQILQDHAGEMAAEVGPGVELIGLGTGAGTKTRLLLEKLQQPAAYVPVDISRGQLERSTTLFRKLFPGLEIVSVCTDYLKPFAVPTPRHAVTRKVVYFPGSTIGNFEPSAALQFLRRIAEFCEKGGGLLIGVDLRKDPKVIELAYNDPSGVTAEFNLNLLTRANRELGANFDVHNWRHRAVYNQADGRIEMNLISVCDQKVQMGEHQFDFEAGEKIITEFSYKHSPEGFRKMAAEAGFAFRRLWTDEARLFGVFYFTAER